MAVFRRLSERWAEETHHYHNYTLGKKTTDNENILTIKYDMFDKEYLREIKELMDNYKMVGYINDIEHNIEENKKVYKLNLSGNLARAIRGHSYRIEQLFGLRAKKAEETLVNSILETNYNLQMRDLIATYVNELYLTQKSSLSRGVNLFEQILSDLNNHEKQLPYLPDDKPNVRVRKVLESYNDKEMVDKLETHVLEWINDYT
ncbi:unnamed protein product [marine sediment metagenome]|uniref:Uncharacterized protein n=1 Tax=marine sediment metagenome TaxID=412755 RepID=X0U0U5_9ZZZZ